MIITDWLLTLSLRRTGSLRRPRPDIASARELDFRTEADFIVGARAALWCPHLDIVGIFPGYATVIQRRAACLVVIGRRVIEHPFVVGAFIPILRFVGWCLLPIWPRIIAIGPRRLRVIIGLFFGPRGRITTCCLRRAVGLVDPHIIRPAMPDFLTLDR
ncbi:MAG: hypothetical protein ACR2QH_16820 [Geminicoccaceae bacterium]